MKSKCAIFFIICGVLFFYLSCKKKEDPIKLKYGLFPETLVNIYEMDDKLDDKGLGEHVIRGNIAILFSNPNNQSAMEQGAINFIFDQTTGEYRSAFGTTNDIFTQMLIDKAGTQGSIYAPYRFFCKSDGFEYFILSSENTSGNLDLFYLKNMPMIGTNYPEIKGPFPITLLSTTANDSYLSFNNNFDTAYFSSDRDGTFDIYMHALLPVQPFLPDVSLSDQLDKPFFNSKKLDDINSNANDMCPFFHKNVMVFASDRTDLGGFGGFDLYYSVFKNGKWSSPINFGPEINTEADEYNPILGSVTDFKSSYLIFNRKEKGRNDFDFYFTGITLPK